MGSVPLAVDPPRILTKVRGRSLMISASFEDSVVRLGRVFRSVARRHQSLLTTPGTLFADRVVNSLHVVVVRRNTLGGDHAHGVELAIHENLDL
jgi:hypothetical protein